MTTVEPQAVSTIQPSTTTTKRPQSFANRSSTTICVFQKSIGIQRSPFSHCELQDMSTHKTTTVISHPEAQARS
jgi:hypothetical protein